MPSQLVEIEDRTKQGRNRRRARHWGRGRGDWAEADHPPHWREKVHAVVIEMRKVLDQLWEAAGKAEATVSEISPQATAVISQASRELLVSLYSHASLVLGEEE